MVGYAVCGEASATSVINRVFLGVCETLHLHCLSLDVLA